jgi:hypothetical protein
MASTTTPADRLRIAPGDLEEVRGLTALVSDRGFAPGRDLAAELARIL